MTIHSQISRVTERMIERSKPSREIYLSRLENQIQEKPNRSALGCGNLAHGFAACGPDDKAALSGDIVPNLGIITAYNDMLSAHQPYKDYPDLIKQTAREAGGVAQIAAGVPAMCDGITQGFPGMELSLFSRDLIAMSASIGLTHNMFDGVLFLGICDKIVPGLVIAALTFGHLPAIFVPAGPMPTGLPNQDKAKIRQLYAEGKIGREELLKGESQSYHAPGTCTFYGTANTNQMLMEFMGLHLPGSSFINPGTPLRDALTKEATRRALSITALGNEFTPVGKMINERSFVNAIIGLHATGGSTNLTLHLIAMARAGGIHLTLEDIADLSEVIPLLARVYPNGMADVNHFHAAGGIPFLIGELLDNGLLHEDVNTIVGEGLSRYRFEPKLGKDGGAIWEEATDKPGNEKILTRVATPFAKSGGLKILSGNLGQAVSKVSAVKTKRHLIEAPAIVFHDQHEIVDAFKAGELDRDFIAVLRFQGPKANGMPELHKMVPPLGVLQDRGFNVALVTDGRMSGASGKIPSAIHVTPEAAEGGNIGKIETGDIIRLDANAGTLELLVDADVIAGRTAANPDLSTNEFGLGRELFATFRANVSGAEMGASVI
ncbi:MAG: phosphogluconate dehydratase [Rhizobiaceae bacterium]|nr:phosphogluconate dehydratase [Rhizobiaceae bacterium]